MPSREAAVEALFAEAMDLPPTAREKLLRRKEEEDLDVVTQVRRLLTALDSRPDFLTSPPTPPLLSPDSTSNTTAIGEPLADFELPSRIGKYELVRKVGAGGMGTVFEARQELPRRRVAVKLLRMSSDSDAGLERFEREANTVARLHHPAIAQIYEAAIETIAGRRVPYLVMELIPDGQTITSFAREHELSIEAKLELFLRVCDGVEHAHQKGVIHRDLKPGNVLIGANEEPKVIDFGIARLLEEEADSAPTAVEGTVWYMSPEQVWASAGGLDTRSDVYSLGILLYALTCRAFPFEVSGKDFKSAIETITEAPRIEARIRNPALDEDLNAIITRAVHVDPDHRYRSVGALAEDLRRYLRSEPINARPPSLAHSFRLLTRRRRGLVTTVGILLVLLLAALTSTTFFWFRSAANFADFKRAQASEDEQRELARQARTELLEMRQSVGLGPVIGTEQRTRWLIGSGSERLEANRSAPRLDAERERTLSTLIERLRSARSTDADNRSLRQALAETLLELGDVRGAAWNAPLADVEWTIPSYREAERLLHDIWREDPSETEIGIELAGARIRLSQAHRKLGDGPAARRFADGAVTVARSVYEASPGLEVGLLLVSALWARSDGAFLRREPNAGLRDGVRTVELAEELARDAPRNDRVLEAQAWSHHRVGTWLHRAFDDVEETRFHYEKSSDARMQLCRLRPDRVDAIHDLLQETRTEVDLIAGSVGPREAALRQQMILGTAREAIDKGDHREDLIEPLALASIELARLFLRADEPSSAFAVCRGLTRDLEALRRERGDDSLRPLLVEALMLQARAGRPIDETGANADLDRALQLAPGTDPELIDELAQTLEDFGRDADAQRLTRTE